jgi:hypothetical protein
VGAPSLARTGAEGKPKRLDLPLPALKDSPSFSVARPEDPEPARTEVFFVSRT